MISNFILQNRNTMEKITFGQDFDCDFVFLSGGLDWGNVPASHNTYSYPDQIGDSISSSKINNREITVEGWAYYTLSPDDRQLYPRDEWVAFGYSKVKQKKKKLNEIINPQNYVRFIINDYYIEGKPEASPKYSTTDGENNTYFCKFTFTIFCANPMFRKVVDTKTVLSGENPTFHFPFILEPTGYIMGTRINYLILIVGNEGDIPVGGIIKIKAKGEIVNPVIENISTGEKIKINKTMQSGEIITINTNDGEQKGITGYYQGVEMSYLQYWDFDNDWFKFEAGASVIGYSCENQSESLMDVSIDINPSKFGLEEM